MRASFCVFLGVAGFSSLMIASDSSLPHNEEIYGGWLQMYDLKFDEAHQTFVRYQQQHPSDPLGPASNAAAYLFSELARLGSLEAELFVDDRRFVNRSTLRPDPQARLHFAEQIDRADQLADSALHESSRDANALFVKSLTFGLRADYAALVDGQGLTALKLTNQGRAYANTLMALDPNAYDAHLGPGVENYLLSLKPMLMRVLLRFAGSSVDREKGIQELQMTASHGYYLEPFAKLLLVVAALRNNNHDEASAILKGLRDRFPDNDLYSREIERLDGKAQ